MSESYDLITSTVSLLQALIRQPSFSREEGETALIMRRFLEGHGAFVYQKGNNVWAKSDHWNPEKPTLLLNSHHDTVKPVSGWTYDPFGAVLEDGRLTGLGSNDAGASLVCLAHTFCHFREKDLPFNLLFVASAEEEISGKGGIASVLPELGPIWAGIVGEPTQLDLAIAEKGLLVIDGVAHGKAGHAAREEGENAIYKALKDIERLKQFEFPESSPMLGPVKVSVTQIEAGKQHNVVPDRCSFVVDVRTNECYSNQEAFEQLQALVESELTARSFRLNSSRIPPDHPLVRAGIALGRKTFGSPTLSDQALMPFSTVKMGPGDSARSHTANEYILVEELEDGLKTYINLIDSVARTLSP